MYCFFNLSGALCQVVAECLELIWERRLDELLSFVPDDVIDRCLQRRKQRCAETRVHESRV